MTTCFNIQLTALTTTQQTRNFHIMTESISKTQYLQTILELSGEKRNLFDKELVSLYKQYKEKEQ